MTDPFETRLESLAQDLSYPPTPQIARKVMLHLQKRPARLIRSRLSWGLAILLALIIGLMAVPPVRAAVLDFIQIGVVRIFFGGDTSAPTAEAIRTATPASTSLIGFLDQIAGETTLEQAQQSANFQIPLPTYPADLGKPDRVFLQDLNGVMLVLVWENTEHPGQIDMSLQFVEDTSWAIVKNQPTLVQETTVNGQYAAWTVGPYPLLLRNRNIEFTRLVEGHVLIWSQGHITYRLETNVSLEEAVRIAESLQPSPGITPTP